MTFGKSPFSIGNTSSSGGCFIVMLVFRGVVVFSAAKNPDLFSSSSPFCLGLRGLKHRFQVNNGGSLVFS